MSRESFEDKFKGSKSVPGDIDIDKVPPPDSYPEPMPGEEPEVSSKFDINPEEHLLEEDEVEEIYREKPEKKEKAPVSKEKLGDTEINKRIIEAQSTINKIEAQLEIEIDEKKRLLLNEFLEKTKSELDKLLSYR